MVRTKRKLKIEKRAEQDDEFNRNFLGIPSSTSLSSELPKDDVKRKRSEEDLETRDYDLETRDDDLETDVEDNQFSQSDAESPIESDYDIVDSKDDEEEYQVDHEAFSTWLASFFIFNNMSENFQKDFADICKHFGHFNVTKNSVTRSIRDLERNVPSESFKFCSVEKCQSLLSAANVCQSSNCSQKGVRQNNHAGNKELVFYSIREQIEEILRSGKVNPDRIKTRVNASRLGGKIREIPKFRKISESYELKNGQQEVTLLISLATDGFRKVGRSRCELWPIFLTIHDVQEENCSEYDAENAVLVAIVKCPSLLRDTEIRHVFWKLKEQINEINTKPLRFEWKQMTFDARLAVYNVVLDMDASRKIFGLPNWRSYTGCARCNVRGEMIPGPAGSMKICWMSGNNVRNYDDHFHPQIKPVDLPPPWQHSYDFLHIFSLGVNRNRLNEIFEPTSSVPGGYLSRDVRKVQNELRNGQFVTGKGMKMFEKIRIHNVTASESDEIFHHFAPLLMASAIPRIEGYDKFLLFQWIMSRKLKDAELTKEDAQRLKLVAEELKNLAATKFPSKYSMKFHVIVDHAIPDLLHHGSPHVTTSCPYERYNQVIGRHVNEYNTAPLKSMGNRFVLLSNMRDVMLRLKSSLPIPRTMRSLTGGREEQIDVIWSGFKLEDCPDREREALRKKGLIPESQTSQYCVDKQRFRPHANGGSSQLSYVRWRPKNTREYSYGRLERIVRQSGKVYFVMLKFSVDNPFPFLSHPSFATIGSVINRLNSYFKVLTGFQTLILEPVNTHFSHCIHIENDVSSYLSVVY